MSNVKVYDGFLSIGLIATAQASHPQYLLARSESLLFLDSIPSGLNWYLESGIKPLFVISNVLFCNKSTDSLNALYIIRAQRRIVGEYYISLRSVTMTTPSPFICHLLICHCHWYLRTLSMVIQADTSEGYKLHLISTNNRQPWLCDKVNWDFYIPENVDMLF